jgi:predicted DNA-binding helix-hairpin-helix protein
LVAAVRNREKFPVEINRAPLETLLKVPGIGPKTAKRLAVVRQRHRFTSLAELKNVGVVTKRAKPFILIDGRPQGKISSLIATKQLPLFKAEPENEFSAPGPFILAGH